MVSQLMRRGVVMYKLTVTVTILRKRLGHRIPLTYYALFLSSAGRVLALICLIGTSLIAIANALGVNCDYGHNNAHR